MKTKAIHTWLGLGLGLTLVSGCGPEAQEGAAPETPTEVGAVGQRVTFLNGGFENGPTYSGCSTVVTSSTAFSDWTLAGNVTLLKSCAKASAEGVQSISFNSGNISQTFTTVVGGGYTVTFSFSKGLGCSSTTNSYLDISYQGTTNNFSTNSTSWASRTVVFNATSTSTTLLFKNTYASGGCPAVLDKVTVSGP